MIRPIIKTILLCPGRCGSNLLVQSINSHPEIHLKPELFANLSLRLGNSGREITTFASQHLVYKKKLLNKVDLNETFKKAFVSKKKVKCVGFTLHYWQIFPELWEKVNKENLKFIFLYRENLLEQYVSILISNKTKVHITYNEEYQNNLKLSLDFKKTENFFTKMNNQNDFYKKFVSNKNSYLITYETLCSEFQNSMLNLQSFLNLKNANISPVTKKIIKQPMCDVVLNYRELKKYFINTKWSKFFK